VAYSVVPRIEVTEMAEIPTAEVAEAAETIPIRLLAKETTSTLELYHRLTSRPNWRPKAIHRPLDLAHRHQALEAHRLHRGWDTTMEGTIHPTRTTTQIRTATTRTATANRTTKAMARDTVGMATLAVEEGEGMISIPMVTEEVVGAEGAEAVVEVEATELEETTIGTDT
jgi:hypothetical protein